MPYSARSKDPNSVELFTFDWTPYLGSGESITASTWSTPSGITVVDDDFSGTSTSLKLSGGTNGQEYYFVNHVTTAEGEYEWDFKVSVYQFIAIPSGPPFASIREAEVFHPPSEGNEALTIETVLYSASDMVARFAPRPNPARQELTASMDDTQTTIPVPKIEDFRYSSVVRIDGEVIQYASKAADIIGASTGTGTLTEAIRGRFATAPASHSAGATVEDVDYALKARRAELMVFAWLWDTRGYKPSRTGAVGSESYTIDPTQVREIVKGAMGDYYTGGGTIKSATITSAFPRSYRSRHYPYGTWVGNG